ncbi:hypothetical protein [Pseudomonas sp. HUK17]|uniref:hypothetical protein n=1 Tax=Pseudomonas sp. HUK17 TaxID=1799359 RepID=UPI00128EE0F5|nr:hypothetical protein [Pseudomonas sp. HUK17]
MIKEKYDLAFALRRWADAMASLSDDDLQKLADESFSIEIKFSKRRSKNEYKTLEQVDISELAEKLISIQSRDLAFSFLNENFKTKKGLESIARALDVVVLKTDKAESLAEKIVESTVGARKRSEAIQGYRSTSAGEVDTEENKT